MRIVMFASPPRARRCAAVEFGRGWPLVCAPSPCCMSGPCVRRAPVVPRQGSMIGGLARGPLAGGHGSRVPPSPRTPHARPRPRAPRCLSPRPPPAPREGLEAAHIYICEGSRDRARISKFEDFRIQAEIHFNKFEGESSTAGVVCVLARLTLRPGCPGRGW